MDAQAHFADAKAKMIDAYTKSWWTMPQVLGGFRGGRATGRSRASRTTGW